VNAIGDSLASNTVMVTTLGVAPVAPSGLAATVISARVDLTWVDNSGANETGFRLERALADTFTPLDSSFTLGANVTAYSDNTVGPATTYYYRIFAVNGIGDSPASNTVMITMPNAPPQAPSGLTATKFSDTRIDLAWTDMRMASISKPPSIRPLVAV
jgi:titin